MFVKQVIVAALSLLACSSSAFAQEERSLRVADDFESDLQCIGYTPFHSAQYPSNVAAALNNDLAQIAQHFRCIKTWNAQYYGLNIGDYAHQHGLKVVIGVQYNSNYAEAEIQAAIAACKNYGPKKVLSIIVGSEDAWNHEQILAVANRIKSSGCKAPVGTSQRIGDYLNGGPATQLMSLDFLGATIYPIFSSGTDASNPISMFKIQWNQLLNAHPDVRHKFRLTETGWPTGGSNQYGNQPSTNTAALYFKQFSQLSCDAYFGIWNSYFIFYDERSPQALDVNQYFGLATADGRLKFSLNSICP